MDRQTLRKGLELDKETTADQQIKFQRFFEQRTLVVDHDLLLVESGNASELEFVHQAPFVDTLQQSWSHDPVHFDGGANSLTREPISLREERVHRGLTFEHKHTKQTKRANRFSLVVSSTARPRIISQPQHALQALFDNPKIKR